MVIAIEDLPASLAGVVEGDDEHRLFRSPLRVYQLLLDLSALARKHGGLSMAFSYVTVKGEAEKWQSNMSSGYVGEWAVRHGFPRASRGGSPAEEMVAPVTGQGLVSGGSKPCINVQRLRQTALERRRRPIAHSSSTLNDYYLRRSPQVLDESRNIVREALDGEVAKARRVLEIPVFTRGFLERAKTDPAGAAAEMGVDTETFKRIVAGDQDTVLASCTDHRNGPRTSPGTVCDESFLHCLSCSNARALAHQLPVQVTAYDRLATLRADLEPHEWDSRYGEPYARLTDLLRHYSPQDRDDARSRVPSEDRDRVAALLDGRLDLR